MRTSQIVATLFGCFLTLVTSVASATTIPTPLFTFTTSFTVDFNNFNIGNEFQTSSQLYVSKIGAFIAPSQVSGGLTTVQYGAYLYADDNSTLLASATIPIGTPVVSNFAFVPLTYTLLASTNYVLTSHTSVLNSSSTYSFGAPATPTGTWALGSTFIQNWYGPGLGLPTSTNGGYQEFMGGNLMVADELAFVPEPSTLALLGLGAIGLAIKTRRRRRAAA